MAITEASKSNPEGDNDADGLNQESTNSLGKVPQSASIDGSLTNSNKPVQ